MDLEKDNRPTGWYLPGPDPEASDRMEALREEIGSPPSAEELMQTLEEADAERKQHKYPPSHP